MSRLVTSLCAAALLLAGSATAHAQPHRPMMLVIGDSNIYGAVGLALEEALVAGGWSVVRFGKPGTGLSRPDYFDWPAKAADMLARFDPDAVIVMFGANDAQRVLFRGPPRRARVYWRYEAHWRYAYGERVRRLAGLLRGDPARPRQVFVLGPTNRRNPVGVARMGRIRDVQRTALAGMDRVTWVDMFPLSSDFAGRYLHFGYDLHGEWVRFRRRDGRHLTKLGGVEVVRRLLPVLFERGLALSARPPPTRPGG